MLIEAAQGMRWLMGASERASERARVCVKKRSVGEPPIGEVDGQTAFGICVNESRS